MWYCFVKFDTEFRQIFFSSKGYIFYVHLLSAQSEAQLYQVLNNILSGIEIHAHKQVAMTINFSFTEKDKWSQVKSQEVPYTQNLVIMTAPNTTFTF